MIEQNGRWRATYAPGTWVVLSGPTLLVVMPPAAPKHSDLIAGIWSAVVASGTVFDLTESLARVRMERLPDFGAFFWADGGMRALVRGAVQVRDAASGDVLVMGEGMQTWAEIGLGDVTRFDVTMPGEAQDGLRLPLVTGAVTAGHVHLDCTDEARLVFPGDDSATLDEPAAVPHSDVSDGVGDSPGVQAPDATTPPAAAEGPAALPDAVIAAAILAPDADVPVSPVDVAGRGSPRPESATSVGREPLAGRDSSEPVAADDTSNEPSAEEDEVAPVDLDLPSTLMADPPVASLETDYVPPSGPAVAAFDVEPTEVLPATSHGPGDPPTLADPLALSAPAVASFSPPPAPGAPAPEGVLPPGMPAPAARPAPPVGPPFPAVRSQDAGLPGQAIPGTWATTEVPSQATSPHGAPPPAEWRPSPSQGYAAPAPMPPQVYPPQMPPGLASGERPGGFQPGSAAQPQAPQPGQWQPVSPAGGPPPAPYQGPIGSPAGGIAPAGGPVISGLPSFGTTPPPAVPAPASASEHDGETIFATGIAATHKAGSRTPAHADLVLAAMCNRQHPNPPDALVCARCGGSVDRSSPQLVAVPALAVLRASTGQTAELAGVVLVGRAPQAQPSDHDAELLTVPSPSQDISRTHVRVAAVQWEIVVTDLHSTNGTILVRPGDQPVRMVPGEPVAVGLGSVLDLGDGVVVRIDQPH